MDEDKRDFAKMRTVIRNFEKKLANLNRNLDQISGFIDKMEYRLYEEISTYDQEEEEYL